MSIGTPGIILHRAFVALGSNTGDKLKNIERACRAIDAEAGTSVRRTSGLWETAAMYVVDQDSFYNGVCEVESTLSPHELLDTLERIEKSLGRKTKQDKGPRTIDLDILLYEDETIESPRLSIPHKLMLDREFVLRPLSEILLEDANFRPFRRKSLAEQLEQVSNSEQPITTVTPLSSHLPVLEPLRPVRRTLLMSILNVTPDSFSDGGVHSATDQASLTRTLKSHILAGASIIDIGGQSSRPHAAPILASEETSRVLPTIQFIKSLASSHPDLPKPAISIDTYRASVAKAAVEAGASIVNDVSAGTLDASMLSTVAQLGCTVILMHMRGDPGTMTSAENTSYPDGLIPTVARELLERVHAAEKAGIRRWRIILDPGIGFAKTAAQNMELLRRFGELRNWKGLRGFPWVVGTSRKGFIGKVTGVKEPVERTWGTAAAVAAAVQGGADVVRVHDVNEMGQVVKMANAIWRV